MLKVAIGATNSRMTLPKALLLTDGLWNQLLDQLTQLHLERSFGFWRFRIGARGSQRARMPDGSRSEAPALLASCIKRRMGSKNSFLFKVFSTGLVRLLRQLLRGFPGHLLRSNASSERDRRWSYSRNCRQAPRARIQEKPGHQGARFIEGAPVKDWEVVFRIFIPCYDTHHSVDS